MVIPLPNWAGLSEAICPPGRTSRNAKSFASLRPSALALACALSTATSEAQPTSPLAPAPAGTSAAADYLRGEAARTAGDLASALDLYKTAAAQGDADAEYRLGTLYLRGSGVAQNYGQAWGWFQKAAAQNNAHAEYELGMMYGNGLGVSRDLALSMAWFQKAAAQGDADGENGVAIMYAKGLGVPRDFHAALAWFEKAAAAGSASAQSSLGAMYANGEGVGENLRRAFAMLQQAAAQGNADAEVNLGILLFNGESSGLFRGPTHYDQAMAWFQKAAAQGDVRADMFIAQMYAEGAGVKRDMAQAQSWWTKAAADGGPWMQRQLAFLPGGPQVSPPVSAALKAAMQATAKNDWIAAKGKLEEARRVQHPSDFDLFLIDDATAFVAVNTADHSAALTSYKRMIASPYFTTWTTPDEQRAMLLNAMILSNEAGLFDDTIGYGGKLAPMGPLSESAAVALAFGYFGNRDYADAEAVAQKAVDAAVAVGKQPSDSALQIVEKSRQLH